MQLSERKHFVATHCRSALRDTHRTGITFVLDGKSSFVYMPLRIFIKFHMVQVTGSPAEKDTLVAAVACSNLPGHVFEFKRTPYILKEKCSCSMLDAMY